MKITEMTNAEPSGNGARRTTLKGPRSDASSHSNDVVNLRTHYAVPGHILQALIDLHKAQPLPLQDHLRVLRMLSNLPVLEEAGATAGEVGSLKDTEGTRSSKADIKTVNCP